MAINHMFIIICVSYQYMGGDKKSITKGENQKGASDISLTLQESKNKILP